VKRAPNDGFPRRKKRQKPPQLERLFYCCAIILSATKKKAKAAFNVGLCLFLGKLNCGYISVSLNLPQLKLLADASQF